MTVSKFLQNLGLSLASLLLILCLLEILSRLIFPEIFSVMNERDFFCEYDSKIGWVNKPMTEGKILRRDFEILANINSKGLRDEEHSYVKPQGIKRILVLGDEFAWGYGVNEGKRFTELLEKKSEVEVINMGVIGYGQDQELLLLEREGIKFQPDLVLILVHMASDFESNVRTVAQFYPKPVFYLKNGRLTLTNVPVPKETRGIAVNRTLSNRSALWNMIMSRTFRQKKLRSYFVQFLDRESGPHALQLRRSPDSPAEITCALSGTMRQMASKNNAAALFVIIPSVFPGTRTFERVEAAEDFKGCLKSKQIEFLDLEPVFDSHFSDFPDVDLILKKDPRWNPLGHKVVAQAIADYLKDHPEALNRETAA